MAWEIGSIFINKDDLHSNKPLVNVCVPHTGSWSAEFSNNVFSILKHVPHPNFAKNIQLSRGTPVDVARNQMVQLSLKDPNVTHIMFWDTDVVPESPSNPNELINTLLQCNAPIASASYRARQKNGFNYASWIKVPGEKALFAPIEEWTGNWIKVDVVGMGACLVQRTVFEQVPPPWFVWDDMAGTPSEDFYFCLKAAEYNFETRVFMDAHCSHISGQLKVLWDGTVTTCDV